MSPCLHLWGERSAVFFARTVGDPLSLSFVLAALWGCAADDVTWWEADEYLTFERPAEEADP